MKARRLALIVTTLVLAAPASASAATFCVHDPAGCVGTTQANLQAALNAAAANGAGKDTIRLGTGLFTDAPAVNAAGNPVDIIGDGANKTAIRSNSAVGGLVLLDIQEPGTTISDMRVHHTTAAATATGIVLKGDARDVMVTNQGIAGQFDGIRVTGTGVTIDDSSVSLVYPDDKQNRAISVGINAEADITDSYLEGTVGVTTLGGTAEVSRTRIRATQGVVAGGASSVDVNDTEVRVPGPMASNFQRAAFAAAGDDTVTLDVDRATAYSTASGSYGVWVVPNGGAGNNSTVNLRGSVIDGFTVDLVASESGGASATVTATRSAYAYSSTSIGAGATYTQGVGNLNLTVDPKFVNASSGDLYLRHDSPLIDAGDPAYQPLLGGLDVGLLTRVRDGNGNSASSVDLGAREYQRRAPEAVALATTNVAQVGEAVAFNAEDSSDVDHEDLTYEWTFSDGASATGDVVQHAFATGGTHSATLEVTDPVGLSDTATVSIEVLAPAPNGGSGDGTKPSDKGSPANAAPQLSGLRVSPARFRAAGKRKPKRGSSTPVGTKIAYSLSEDAHVSFVIERKLPGRVSKGVCRRPSGANRSSRRCTRWLKIGTLTGSGKAGANSQSFNGRVGKRALAAGGYRLRAVASDGAGLRSAEVLSGGFSVVR